MVELLYHFGDDLMVVNAARVSYGKNKEIFDTKDERLIKYLVEHKHTSVFRHPQLQYRITCPIYVERQLFKHQVGLSANSISGRYVDFSDSYYQIEQFRDQSKSSKQGSGENLKREANLAALQVQEKAIAFAKLHYEALISLGVSKEQARSVLPLSLNTTFIWTGSLLAFFHLFNLRLKSDTQEETRDIAKQMVQVIREIPGEPFKQSLKAFNL